MSRRERRFAELLADDGERERFVGAKEVSGDFMGVCRSGDPWKATQPSGLPLHMPTVYPIPERTVKVLRRSRFLSPEERRAFEYLRDTDLYSECTRYKVLLRKSDVDEADLMLMISSGVFERASDMVGAGYVFPVYEEIKQRRRLVHDALTPNVLCADPPNPFFKTVVEVQQLLHMGLYAATIDLKACFYQFVLKPQVRKYFSVAILNEVLQPTRLPMGFKWSVVMAQALLKHFVGELGLSMTCCDCYVDNVLVVGPMAKVRKLAERLCGLFSDAGVTVGDRAEGATVEHRGMSLDFENKTVALKAAFVEKLRRRVESSRGTWGETRSIIGSVVYACQVLHVPLASLFHVFKFWARNIRTGTREVREMWEVSKAEMRTALDIIFANAPVPVMRARDEAFDFIVTDASTSEQLIAGIYVSGGSIRWFSEKVTCTNDIAVLEMMAVARAVRTWLERPGSTTHIISDNVVVLNAMAKGLTANFGVNRIVVSLIPWMERRDAQCHLWYVASAANPTDPLTRDFVFSALHKQHIERLVRLSTLRMPNWVDEASGQRKLYPGSLIPIRVWEL